MKYSLTLTRAFFTAMIIFSTVPVTSGVDCTPTGTHQAEFDKVVNGGNGDALITNRDSIFASLRLWLDTNHNGVSEPGELKSLSNVGLSLIELSYKRSKREDEYGNSFRYRAKVADDKGAQLGRWAWDVFLVAQP